MRFIRPEDVQVRLPAEWETGVATAIQKLSRQVRLGARQGRADGKCGAALRKHIYRILHETITSLGEVWTLIKDDLAFVSVDKCWYCECRQDRSDLHVDHFRPKNRITGERNHPGYWWLAFNWRNFRLACVFCNCVREDSETDEIGGKGNAFPIFDDVPRMRRASDPADRAKLLDPCVRQDVELLTFKRNGLAYPASTNQESEQFKRAEETIVIFNLRHTRLKRARETLALELERDIGIAKACMERNDLVSFQQVADGILARMRHDAQYSTFARFIVGAHRDVQWVAQLWEHL
jgi:uncharacterized protein (TIGR02646 family)